MELIFEVRDAEEGGYFARALGHSIFTEGDDWEQLRANVLEATALHFEDEPCHNAVEAAALPSEESSELPQSLQLHYCRMVTVTAADFEGASNCVPR